MPPKKTKQTNQAKQKQPHVLFLDLKEIRELLAMNVSEDIKEFGKPAFIYNYLHIQGVLNAMDTQQLWEKEKKTFADKGWTLKKEDREIDIGGKKWKGYLWILQPWKDGKIDEKKYFEVTNLTSDPLALTIGYMVSGLCYLQLLDS